MSTKIISRYNGTVPFTHSPNCSTKTPYFSQVLRSCTRGWRAFSYPYCSPKTPDGQLDLQRVLCRVQSSMSLAAAQYVYTYWFLPSAERVFVSRKRSFSFIHIHLMLQSPVPSLLWVWLCWSFFLRPVLLHHQRTFWLLHSSRQLGQYFRPYLCTVYLWEMV